MALTGDPDGPPLAPPTAPAQVVDDALRPFGLDASVLAERAALLELERAGTRSCGGSSRLLQAADGWVAMTLAREDDVISLPAVFEVEPDRLGPHGVGANAPWDAVARMVSNRPAAEVVGRAILLGLPAGVVGEGAAPFRSSPRLPSTRSGPVPSPLVLDLTALWAGPLATSCLLRAGAEVVKVEDRNRPDGSRRGDPRFFELMNAGKRSVVLDLRTPTDRSRLHGLVSAANIVVTSARPRALEQMGLEPNEFLAGATDRVWVAITAHGWGQDRVGFGDDIAASAGLVAWLPDGSPRFVSDAIADPLGGARTAAATWEAWTTGGRQFIDASLAGAAATVVDCGKARAASWNGRSWSIDGEPVAMPQARTPETAAATFGADTAAILARWT